MARARNIKPGFFKNELLVEMPFETRLLFIGLWTLADREGRFEDRPKRIRAEIFPYDQCDVDSMLDVLAEAAFLLRYEVDGKKYCQILNFAKHQMPHHKEVASEIPSPPGHAQITRHAYAVTPKQRSEIFERDGNKCLRCGKTEKLSIDHIVPLSKGGDNSSDNLQTLCLTCNSCKQDATISYVGSTLSQERTINNEGCPSDSLIPSSLIPSSLIPDTGLLIADSAPKRGARASPKKSKAPSKIPLPDGFGISERIRQWAADGGYVDIDRHFENFVGACKAKGYVYADWDQALMNAIRDNWAKVGLPQPRASPKNFDLAAAQKAANEEAKRRLFGSDDGMTIDAE